MNKILEFLSENFQFLVVKFSVYLNRRVFVMICLYNKNIYLFSFYLFHCSLLLAYTIFHYTILVIHLSANK